MTTPTIAVKESLDDLKGIGPSTGISGFKLVYVIGKGLYQYKTGDQSSNVPSGNDGDVWVAPAEDTSGKSGAWQLDGSGILDPEHATDSGTDTYVSATNTTVPGDGVTITRDFQSANTTTTPTLDGKTMTTRDGSALWPGAVSGPHELQRDQTADTYLVLDPLPIDEDDMASDSASAVPTQQSVAAFVGAEKIESGSVSTAATLEITGLTSTYRAYVLVFTDLIPDTDVSRLIFRVTTDGGSTFDSGASDYLFAGHNLIGGFSSGAASEIRLIRSALGTAAGEPGVCGEIWIHGIANAGAKTGVFCSVSAFKNSGGVIVGSVASGRRDTEQAEDGFQLSMDSGNISNLAYTLYGLR